jgi:murein DD-endopeptidase MepM/ murein hydrolase activator NlpD
MRVGPRLGTAVVLCAGLLLGAGGSGAAAVDEPHAAQTAPPTTAELIDQVRADLAESSAAMVQAATSLRLAEAALPEARLTLARTGRLLAAAQRRQEAAAQRRGQAQSALILAGQDNEALTDAVDAQHARVGRLARSVYQGGGPLGGAAMLLEATSPSDFAERLFSLQAVAASQRSALADLQVAQQSSGAREARLAQIRSTVVAADRQAQAELAVISDLEAQASAAASKVGRLVRARRAAVVAGRAAAADDSARAASLAAEGGSLQSALAAQAARELGPAGARHGYDVPVQPGALARPVSGPVTSPFGMRVHPITGVRKLHTGADFGVPCGTPVRVARAGTVLSAGYNAAYGYRTVVSHGVVDGALLTTTYNHQTRIDVTVGQQVTVGQVIGISGTTGYSTGCHLHLELLVNADFVDPVPWLAS